MENLAPNIRFNCWIHLKNVKLEGFNLTKARAIQPYTGYFVEL